MSSYKILYWKEIPTQIKYTDSEGSDSSYPLSLFFQQAIDAVAMHDGSISSGEYLGGSGLDVLLLQLSQTEPKVNILHFLQCKIEERIMPSQRNLYHPLF